MAIIKTPVSKTLVSNLLTTSGCMQQNPTRRGHVLLTRQIQHSGSRDVGGYVPGLSLLHIFGSRERKRDQLYVHKRLHWAGWRRVHSMCCRDVQGHEWIGTVLAV